MDAVITSPTTNAKLRAWVDEMTALCRPDQVVWTDGTQQEYDSLCEMMVELRNLRPPQPEETSELLSRSLASFRRRSGRGSDLHMLH